MVISPRRLRPREHNLPKRRGVAAPEDPQPGPDDLHRRPTAGVSA